MQKLKKIALFILVISILIFSAACSETDGSDTVEEEPQGAAVRVQNMSAKNFTDYINVVGVVKPIDQASLAYQEGGIIEKFLKDKGDYVKEGEVIAEIDNESIKANLDAAKAQFDLAQVTFEMQEKVYKDNVNSEFEYLQAKSNRDQAKANFDLTKDRYEKTLIKAPFSGVVNDKYYEAGEYALPGTPIVYLINNSNLKVEAGIPERYVGQIKLGGKVNVRFKDILEENIQGRISFIGASIIPDNRTFPIEVSIRNTKKILKPELIAELFIENKTFEDIFVVPEEVVTRVDQGFIVYVAEDGIAKSRDINIIRRFKDSIAVRNGLNTGDKLITVGYQNLVEDERINIVN